MKTVLSVMPDEFGKSYFVRLRLEGKAGGKKVTHTSYIIDTRLHPHEVAHRIAEFAKQILREEF